MLIRRALSFVFALCCALLLWPAFAANPTCGVLLLLLAAVAFADPTAGVMVVLAVYTLRDFSFRVPDRAWPTAVALACTVGLHLWRRNVPLSIVAGTAVHVALASTVFAH